MEIIKKEFKCKNGKKFDIICVKNKGKLYKCIKVMGFDYYILKEIKYGQNKS